MLLFCAKTIVKESRKFELACLKKKKKKEKKKKKKKKKEKHFGHLETFWFGAFAVHSRCFLAPLGVLFIVKTLEDDGRLL